MSNYTYYVYQITIGNHIYIGCTNSLTRRKDQHNENSRKRKSKLGRYLNDNGIVLKSDDLKVVYSSNDRQDALNTERELTISSENQGFDILNDNYSKDCSRKGKNIGNTSKEYYLVDYINHKVSYVKDLRQYCLNNNLDYKSINRTTKGLRYTLDGYKAFYKDDWEKEINKDKYISGKFISESQDDIIENVIKRSQKHYIVAFPDGHTETVLNLDKFAREHNLTSGTLHATFTKNKPTKGFQVIKRLD